MDRRGKIGEGRSVRPQTAADGVTAILREAIATGTLAPGAALRQDELAREFGVSRMPVRDALRYLEAEGLVAIHPTRGAVVAAMNAADISELYALRELLEAEALSLSMQKQNPDSLRHAASVIEQLDRETDVGRWGQLNREFHLALYRDCGNRRLLDLIEAQHTASDRYVRIVLSNLDYRERSQDEHRAMLFACMQGDRQAAVGHLTRHFRDACAALLDYMISRNTGS